jgi:hypothetical protein
MNEPDRRLLRLCQASAALASVGFALAALWELGDTFGAGHFAAASAVCTAGENMWHWGLGAPVIHELSQAPAPSEFYCHHPWGIFWVSALFMKVFGHHGWACRLPAALQSMLTVPALYFTGRALWGSLAGWKFRRSSAPCFRSGAMRGFEKAIAGATRRCRSQA